MFYRAFRRLHVFPRWLQLRVFVSNSDLLNVLDTFAKITLL